MRAGSSEDAAAGREVLPISELASERGGAERGQRVIGRFAVAGDRDRELVEAGDGGEALAVSDGGQRRRFAIDREGDLPGRRRCCVLSATPVAAVQPQQRGGL